MEQIITELQNKFIFHCPECNCAVGDDWEYKDFSNKNIIVCPQCRAEIYHDDKTIEERAAKILMTWSKDDLIGDILELTTKEGLIEFVEQNEDSNI